MQFNQILVKNPLLVALTKFNKLKLQIWTVLLDHSASLRVAVPKIMPVCQPQDHSL